MYHPKRVVGPLFGVLKLLRWKNIGIFVRRYFSDIEIIEKYITEIMDFTMSPDREGNPLKTFYLSFD